jgi:quercetin dioxygenase-like cupin family protein
MSEQKSVDFASPQFELLGASFRFLAGPSETGFDVGVLAGGIPAGVAVPLHAHADPEVICILEGSLDVYLESYERGWRHAVAGDTVIIPGGVKHALLNKGSADMNCILITQGKLYRFFRDVTVPSDSTSLPPNPKQVERVFGISAEYGYWMGSPQDNAGIGLELPQEP